MRVGAMAAGHVGWCRQPVDSTVERVVAHIPGVAARGLSVTAWGVLQNPMRLHWETAYGASHATPVRGIPKGPTE